MKLPIADAHCHVLDYDAPEAYAQELSQLKLQALCVTTTPEQFLEACEFAKLFPENIFPACGFFPLELSDSKKDLEKFFSIYEKCPSLFIGEVGLDFSANAEHQAIQVEFFTELIAKLNKRDNAPQVVMSVHSRRSGTECLEILQDFKGITIMHWYSGDLPTSLPERTYYSINTAMLRSRKGKEIIRALPLEKILLESDGPYVQYEKRPARSQDLRAVLHSLSAVHQIPVEELAASIQRNFMNLTHKQAQKGHVTF